MNYIKRSSRLSYLPFTCLTYLAVYLAFVLLAASCKKEEPPPNPYDNINRGGNTYMDTLDPNSFVWIHRNILATKCAMPGCHDGSFEPDYRTVQSSYATLVYHPVVKKLSPWNFRVMPKDTAKSWLWQRLKHDLIISGKDTSQGRMPLYAPPLNATEMQRISNWIMNGAKDMFGQTPTLPNNEPIVEFYVAVDAIPPTQYYSADSNRTGGVFYNPFYAPSGNMHIVIRVTDDSTALASLTVNQLKISTDKDNFVAASSFNAVYYDLGGANQYWVATVNTAVFPKNKVLYMRYYVNDGDHSKNTEYPRTDMLDPYKTWWAFIVK